MEYIIIEESSAQRVASEVSRLLNEGWVCQGGLAICREHGSITYCQAMMKQ